MTDQELANAAKARRLPISDMGALRQALTHKSFVPDAPERSNERLEFLGDAVLGLVIGEYLWTAYPSHTEGQLAKARAIIVCKSALAEAARRLDLPPLLRLGRAEEAMGGRARAGLAADAFEAITAAIYRERGYAGAKDFLLSALQPAIRAVDAQQDWRDPKTILQEYRQGQGLPPPLYQVVSEEGLPHNRTYTVKVLLDGELFGAGSGQSKKQAQQSAAQAALDKIGVA